MRGVGVIASAGTHLRHDGGINLSLKIPAPVKNGGRCHSILRRFLVFIDFRSIALLTDQDQHDCMHVCEAAWAAKDAVLPVRVPRSVWKILFGSLRSMDSTREGMTKGFSLGRTRWEGHAGKDMHRAADDVDIIDGIRQPRLRRNLLSHSRINLPVACLRPGARGIALRVLSPTTSTLRRVAATCVA